MKQLRARIGLDSDAGFTMAEALAALMVFTIIALGMTAALGTMTKLTSDDRQREVALGLASQEIGKVRAYGDAFDVNDAMGQTQTVGGVVYTIDRSTQWVNTDGSTATCGGSGGNLEYKRVNVRVTWPNMAILKGPVESDTLLAPANRINDPSYGTIIVSVLGADGTGRAGVAVTATPTSGGATISSIDPTDSDGCSYVLKVTPGTYTVGVKKTGYVDINQLAAPTVSTTITAGATQIASFAFDQAATYNLQYAAGFTGTIKLPSSLLLNFFSAKGVDLSSAKPASIQLYPQTQGYSAVAGSYYDTTQTAPACLDVDPVAWDESIVNGVDMAAGQRQANGVAAGSSGPLAVPMGVIATATDSSTTTLYAQEQSSGPAGTGDPGCASPTTYTFTGLKTNTSYNLALPFGSWIISKTATGSAISNVAPATQGELTGTVVTLDPRSPAS